jgi:hypothetical protein
LLRFARNDIVWGFKMPDLHLYMQHDRNLPRPGCGRRAHSLTTCSPFCGINLDEALRTGLLQHVPAKPQPVCVRLEGHLWQQADRLSAPHRKPDTDAALKALRGQR